MNSRRRGVKRLIESLETQTPYDFMNSTNPDLNGIFTSMKEMADYYLAHALTLPNAITGWTTGNIYYTHKGLRLSVILHENLHKNFTEPSDPSKRISDQTLAEKLGVVPKGSNVFANPRGSELIDDKLEAEGCK